MSDKFCGNPFNHEAHSKDNPDGSSFWCKGVGRIEVKEEVVEKYSPELTEMAEDGTAYSKLKIFIEDADGTTTIIQAQKVSRIQLEALHQKYVSLELPRPYLGNELESVEFSFCPHVEDHHPAFTIERIERDSGE